MRHSSVYLASRHTAALRDAAKAVHLTNTKMPGMGSASQLVRSVADAFMADPEQATALLAQIVELAQPEEKAKE